MYFLCFCKGARETLGFQNDKMNNNKVIEIIADKTEEKSILRAQKY